MEETAFIIRPMQLGDIGAALKLSHAEGWNQTEKDWRLFAEIPENVCVVAEYDNNIVGTTTSIVYSNQLAWIGMVLVDKAYRGRGISKSLLTGIFKKLETFTSIKLDATPAGQQVYKKFEFKDEYGIARMVNSAMKNLPPIGENDITPQPVQLKDLPEIIALDEIIFGVNRAQLIKWLIQQYPGKAVFIKRNNKITGFALGREGANYHHIGPVVASTDADAQILVTLALRKLVGRPIVADVLQDKKQLLDWFHSMGFTQQRHFIRMYQKENTAPGIISDLYLIAGPEFG